MKRNKGAFCLILFCFCITGCVERVTEADKEKTQLLPVTFQELSGWQEDNQKEAIEPLRKSCGVFEKKDPTTRLIIDEAGTLKDWVPACTVVRMTSFETEKEARSFFEKYFTPYLITNEKEGLFTGYYEAKLEGSLVREPPYTTPLWSKPNDLLIVELGSFRESLKGQKITGKIKGNNFVPYDDRALISHGSLKGRAKPLVWVDDPISAFFLEIQGSGQIELTDGTTMRVGYEAQNGHSYTPIGRVLAERGDIEKPVTMQKIRAWLEQHPDQAQEIMDINQSVVFFKKSDKEGPQGAQGVTLTPLRSLAVDPSYIPLGLPLWLDTDEHKRLVVAQDTGGAIKGRVRGDLFWGAGHQAEEGAGRMQNRGRYYLLLPKKDNQNE